MNQAKSGKDIDGGVGLRLNYNHLCLILKVMLVTNMLVTSIWEPDHSGCMNPVSQNCKFYFIFLVFSRQIGEGDGGNWTGYLSNPIRFGHFLNQINASFLLLLFVSYMCTKWVLNPQSHPPPILVRGGSLSDVMESWSSFFCSNELSSWLY